MARPWVVGMILALASSHAGASEERPTRWVVLPAHAEQPPPRDPTLLRLSKEIGEAVHAAVAKEVVVVSRELRDDACPSIEGLCPRDVAAILNAERAISLVLKADYSGLELRVYGSGLEKEATLPCRWSEGLVACETAPIRRLMKRARADEPSHGATPRPPPKRSERPLEQADVDAAMKKLAPRFERCRKLGWGDATTRPASLEIQFRVTEQGKVTEVRLEPRGFDTVPAFSCMARIAESLRFRSGPASPEPYRYKVPTPR